MILKGFYFLSESAVGAKKKGNIEWAWVLDETNKCEIFLPQFFQQKLRVEAHWLSLPSGKYIDLWDKVAIIKSFLKSPMFQYIFS